MNMFFLRYKEDPWLWDLEWTVQEFKQKKIAASKRKQSKKALETQAATPLPEWEEGKCTDPEPCQDPKPRQQLLAIANTEYSAYTHTLQINRL